jgi:anaerobic magnesium-protoporphyrin IX monomethyl ester cyclase
LPDDIGISVSYPLPGTVFYDKVKEQLTKKSNWKDSDDLDLMFMGTYHKEFYKYLQRYIHKRYRKQIALKAIKQFIQIPSFTNLKRGLSLIHLMPKERMIKNKLTKIEVTAKHL